MAERPEDFPDREVEPVGMEQGPDIVLAKAEISLRGGQQARSVGMGDDDALRLSGGARGVDHIGRLIGMRRRRQGGVSVLGRRRFVEEDRLGTTLGQARGEARVVSTRRAPESASMNSIRSAG